MPVPTAETEPTGHAGPSKPAKPFANPLKAKFLCKAGVKLCLCPDNKCRLGDDLRSHCPAKL
jgi:hypothetical protein